MLRTPPPPQPSNPLRAPKQRLQPHLRRRHNLRRKSPQRPHPNRHSPSPPKRTRSRILSNPGTPRPTTRILHNKPPNHNTTTPRMVLPHPLPNQPPTSRARPKPSLLFGTYSRASPRASLVRARDALRDRHRHKSRRLTTFGISSRAGDELCCFRRCRKSGGL